jgi:hypothetical protein
VHPKETEERKLILIRPKLEWDMDLEKRIKDIITGLERIRVGCKKLFCGRSFTINKERYCSIAGSCSVVVDNLFSMRRIRETRPRLVCLDS